MISMICIMDFEWNLNGSDSANGILMGLSKMLWGGRRI